MQSLEFKNQPTATFFTAINLAAGVQKFTPVGTKG